MACVRRAHKLQLMAPSRAPTQRRKLARARPRRAGGRPRSACAAHQACRARPDQRAVRVQGQQGVRPAAQQLTARSNAPLRKHERARSHARAVGPDALRAMRRPVSAPGGRVRELVCWHIVRAPNCSSAERAGRTRAARTTRRRGCGWPATRGAPCAEPVARVQLVPLAPNAPTAQLPTSRICSADTRSVAQHPGRHATQHVVADAAKRARQEQRASRDALHAAGAHSRRERATVDLMPVASPP